MENMKRDFGSPEPRGRNNLAGSGNGTDNTSPVQPKKRLFSRFRDKRWLVRKALPVSIGIVCVGFIIYLFLMWKQTIPTPLPQDSVSSLNYQVYYPSHIPSGYRYKTGSATSHNGLLFFKFNNGKKVITVTEQAAPPKSLDVIKILGGYTSLSLSIGKAGVGASVGRPAVIIITDTTLINITSSQGVTKDQVIAIAQKMKLLEPEGTL